MRFRFNYRRYRLPFRVPVRTAHGVWAEREGIIVRLEPQDDGDGKTDAGVQTTEDGGIRAQSSTPGTLNRAGFGEAGPVPGFSVESVEEIEAACGEIGEWVEEERVRERAGSLACLRNAVEAAIEEAGSALGWDSGGESRSGRAGAEPHLGVAALLPAGRAAVAQIGPKAEIGFRVFKWKVGVRDVADELALLDDVCAALPGGAKLRLDANGAWDRRKAERWLERCAERPVEYLEQPIAADAKGATDLLLGLAGDYPTKIALDESLVGDGDAERWIGAGWPGVFVVKPALLGDLRGVMAKLARAKADVAFSSALETAVGARAALRTAFNWNREGARRETNRDARDGGSGSWQARALGFGVYPLFQDARFDGPAAAPFVRWEDVERMEPSAVWSALGS